MKCWISNVGIVWSVQKLKRDSATQLAAAIRITIQELLEANRAQRLTLERAETGTTGEGAPAKRYTFSVGDKEGSLTIASPTRFGSA
jgi:hypothetical protein